MASVAEENQIEKLIDETSYQVWKFQIMVTFKAYDLYEIVKGENRLENLTKDDEKRDWKKKDARAQKMIVTTIDKKYITHIMDCESSKDMFNKIRNIFEKSSADQICSLLQQFYSFSYEKGSEMSVNISKIESLAHRLKSLNQTIDDNMVISKILSTLPPEYGHFLTAWESASACEKTLGKLTARLLTEEARSKSKIAKSQVAFETTERWHKKDIHKKRGTEERKCFKCGVVGHLARNCGSFYDDKGENQTRQEYRGRNPSYGRSGERKGIEPCKICKKTNHLEQDCFFREKSAQNRDKVAFFAEKEDAGDSQCFVVDSGCTSHMANNRAMFLDIERTDSSIQVAKKGEIMKTEGRGNIEGSLCVLKNVLLVPDLRKNLLSVNAITENDGEVIFTKEKVIIKKNNTEVLRGTKSDSGLYVVNLNQGENSFLAEKKENMEDWHRKLGHLGINNMRKLLDMSTGIKLKKSDCKMNIICEICLQAKQTRFPFNTTRHRAKRCLEILHTDICGPVEPTTWDGKRYILTVLDDYTHYCRVYLLKYKNEAAEYLKEYISEAEAYCNVKVAKIRCDNGGEYANFNFMQYCRYKGIVLDFTIPHTPQLNGKAERLNRTLLEKARALIFDANLEKEFWGEAIYVAAYLLNRSPTEKNEKTPIECWTGREPDLSRLQIFGSTAYARTLGYAQKLDSRSKKYVFVGYSLNGYRLWDMRTRKITTHRDVVFAKPEKDKSISHNTSCILPKFQEQIIVEETETEESEEETEQIDENRVGQTKHLDLGEGTEDHTYQTRSGRQVKRPERLKDYVLNSTDTEDQVFLTYYEAVNGEERDKWTKAIEEEKNSLDKNKAWIYIDKSEVGNKRVLTSRWVFRIKDSGKYKARLVIRGCQQRSGIDYKDTFSPVVNFSAIRVLLALAVKYNMNITTFDIKTAFLYGNLTEDIFMHIPEGYNSEMTKDKVCKLVKSLYGLKQAPLKWNERFTHFLKSYGLVSLKSEQCILKNQQQTLFLAIYVDDGIIISSDQEEVNKLLRSLKEEFEMTVCDDPQKFLGIEIVKEDRKITLLQGSYIESTLEKFGMQNAKPATTPMFSNYIITDKEDSLVYQKYPYREAVGSLLYLTNKTRPDISYAVNFCSRKMENPSTQDVVNIKRIFRYLVSTKGDGISYNYDEDCDKLIAYCDSDYGGDLETRKSTTGYIVFFCGGPILWASRKQPIVSLSSTESEYIAAAECVKELLFIKTVIDELTSKSVKVELNVDNQSAITIIRNGQFNRRSKHIDVRYHFINEKVQEGIVSLKYCPTESQIADILTKALGAVKFQDLKSEFMCNGTKMK